MQVLAGARRAVRAVGAFRQREEWQFFAVLHRASAGLAVTWWALIAASGLLPAAFSVSVGLLVGAIGHGDALVALVFVGAVFLATQILSPLRGQVGANLGDRLGAWLDRRLLDCAIGPAGLAHLEAPDLADDLSLARDYELGLSGPPMSLALSFIAGGLVQLLAGACQSLLLAGYAWWAPILVGGGWLGTHWLLRKSTVWDRTTGDVLQAQRRADYSYRLAVDAPAAKELRLFGLGDWTVARFTESRSRLVDLRLAATKLKQRPLRMAIAALVVTNGAFFAALAHGAVTRQVSLAAVVVFGQAAVGASALAFGGLNWALPHAAGAVAAVLRLDQRMSARGSLRSGPLQADGLPAAEVRFCDVSFGYNGAAPVLDHLDLTVPAGSSLAVVGANGAGKTTLIKLLCRLYDPQAGRIEVDGVDIRELDLDSWRSRITAVFQDFVRYELPLRENVAPAGGADEQVAAALRQAGLTRHVGLGTVLAVGYEGGTDLSGGQWQRVALARALYDVSQGAGLIVLDEPTAQLDVRGESEIFRRILEETRGRTTILISHRFSTVRHADRICVIDGGQVTESGSHEELMTKRGRYYAMYSLQAAAVGDDVASGYDAASMATGPGEEADDRAID